MQRRLTRLLAAVVAVGFSIGPAAHLAALDCADHACGRACDSGHAPPGPHDPDQCGACQLAQMPAMAAASLAPPAPAFVLLAVGALLPEQPAVRLPRLLPFSCGPPG